MEVGKGPHRGSRVVEEILGLGGNFGDGGEGSHDALLVWWFYGGGSQSGVDARRLASSFAEATEGRLPPQSKGFGLAGGVLRVYRESCASCY